MMKFFLAPCLLLASCSLTKESESLDQLWSNTSGAPIDVSTTTQGSLDSERFYAVRGRAGVRQLAAYDRNDGEQTWSSSMLGVCSPPVAVAGRVFCPAQSLYAFDAATGAPLWTYADPSDSTFAQARGTADAARAFAATNTAVSAVDAATGQPLWRRSLSGVAPFGTWIRSLTLSPEGDLLAAIEAFYDGGQYFSAAVVVALDPATGAERWRFQDGGANTDRSIGGLTLWEDLMLYTDATGGEVVAVSRATRNVVWRRPWERGFLGSLRPPLVADGVAYWGGGDSHLYAADARTGALRWSVEPEIGSFVSHEVCGPLVFGSTLYDLRVVRRTDGDVVTSLFGDERVGQTAVADGVLYVSHERGVSAYACG